ncbi:hypothetical protein BO83DRAFT_386305 [Aspergillus eucalypticola CBS 122712]|uniref:Uncharacterized protein n=1 Tax=Aspergillus eucalypticola (strain CBS 122712 / IBT 29274) TaxID=1448314 RepID=A0A317W4K5_ASPEC|nr:uncharacterized protein BO83DRAFT_386305 [Aspergillus eucalypticola CBS 122712]PWY80232.1 hypothetical protein BO83DRAFT_386305 [Aspergillus eucalypticola CBS 122712]
MLLLLLLLRLLLILRPLNPPNTKITEWVAGIVSFPQRTEKGHRRLTRRGLVEKVVVIQALPLSDKFANAELLRRPVANLTLQEAINRSGKDSSRTTTSGLETLDQALQSPDLATATIIAYYLPSPSGPTSGFPEWVLTGGRARENSGVSIRGWEL